MSEKPSKGTLTRRESKLLAKCVKRLQGEAAQDILGKPGIMDLLTQMIETNNVRKSLDAIDDNEIEDGVVESEKESDPHRQKKQFARDLLAAGATVGAFFIPLVGPALAATIASKYVSQRVSGSNDKNGETENEEEKDEQLDVQEGGLARLAKTLAKTVAQAVGFAVGGPLLASAAGVAVEAAASAIQDINTNGESKEGADKTMATLEGVLEKAVTTGAEDNSSGVDTVNKDVQSNPQAAQVATSTETGSKRPRQEDAAQESPKRPPGRRGSWVERIEAAKDKQLENAKSGNTQDTGIVV